MNYKTITYDRLGETLYEYDHPTGLKAFLVRKPGYNKKTALFATDYGSIDNVFKKGDGKVMHVPDGIAHFLEHKLFEGRRQHAGQVLQDGILTQRLYILQPDGVLFYMHRSV